MNYKIIIYFITIFLSIYVLDAFKLDILLKSNKVVQSRILYIILSVIMGYLLTNFITDFIGVSQII